MSGASSGGAGLNQMMVGAWITQGIYVAAELGIADLLTDDPLSIEELAKRAGAHPDSLYRVLRALASIGIFSEDAQRRFSLTPMAECLRSDSPDMQRAFAIMSGSEFYQTWGNLLHSARTGEQGFRKAYGATWFEYMTQHPDRHAIYDAAMTGVHGPETQPVLDAYDFSCFQTVTDVGGGNGSALAAILERHPRVEGILFDLPGVAERAWSSLATAGVSQRCQVVGGDFFDSVPAADAYVLRHVIHDWEDDEAVVILRNCRKSLRPGGKVLVIETVLPMGNQPSFGKWLDLMMLLVGGRERTEDQYRKLFTAAGLQLSRVVPTAHEVSVIEGVNEA
jgi:SAM-dependent methyltransferase